MSWKEIRLRNVVIELHVICFGVLQVRVLGQIHSLDPPNGLTVAGDRRSCERERKSATTCDMNLEVCVPSRKFPSVHARADGLESRSCTFSVACITLNYSMHESTD
jgi:hypothetical protein